MITIRRFRKEDRTQIVVREYQPGDREEAVALLKESRGLDLPDVYTHVVEENGKIVGVVNGVVPESREEEVRLGAVLLKDAQRWDLFLILLASIIQKAIDLGFKTGVSDVREIRITHYLEETFGLMGQPAGWKPNSDKVVQWHYRVNLRDFLAQLEAVI